MVNLSMKQMRVLKILDSPYRKLSKALMNLFRSRNLILQNGGELNIAVEKVQIEVPKAVAKEVQSLINVITENLGDNNDKQN